MSLREFLSQKYKQTVIAQDKPKLARDKKTRGEGFRTYYSTQLLWLKHGELWSSKTARQWENPL